MLRFITTTELHPNGPIAVLHRTDDGQTFIVMNGHISDSALRCDAVNRLLAELPAMLPAA